MRAAPGGRNVAGRDRDAVRAHTGLDELDAIPERELIDCELHASLGEIDRARACLDRALAHQPSRIQRALLERKRAALLQ